MSWREYCPKCGDKAVFDRQRKVCTSCIYVEGKILWRTYNTEEKFATISLLSELEFTPEDPEGFLLKVFRKYQSYDPNKYENNGWTEKKECNKCNKINPHCGFSGCIPCHYLDQENKYINNPIGKKIKVLWEHLVNDDFVVKKCDVYKYEKGKQL